MKSTRGEMLKCIRTDISRLREIGLGQVVCDITNIDRRIQLQELSFDSTHEKISLAYISCQR